jgi:3-hydroxyacyl-[acyl-carrier-protein] dehydratase
MDEIWHNISYKGDTSDGAFLAEASADARSLWFSGHFPGEPILPGIAILSMATDAIRHRELEKGRKVHITSIRRVRFKLPVRPEESLNIVLSLPDKAEELTYHFMVELKGKTVCTGIAVAMPLPDEIRER